jgi:hypothetical protein
MKKVAKHCLYLTHFFNIENNGLKLTEKSESTQTVENHCLGGGL